MLAFSDQERSTRTGDGDRAVALPSHPRENVRPAFTDTMTDLLDAYEQCVWVWAQGCEVDDIRQRSQIGDSYNEGQREEVSKARIALLRQIDALTSEEVRTADATSNAGEVMCAIREAVSRGFVAGATAVHEEWGRDPERPNGDPEFGEAGSDYAADADYSDVLAALRPSPEDTANEKEAGR